jgi:hypothetical protein
MHYYPYGQAMAVKKIKVMRSTMKNRFGMVFWMSGCALALTCPLAPTAKWSPNATQQ